MAARQAQYKAHTEWQRFHVAGMVVVVGGGGTTSARWWHLGWRPVGSEGCCTSGDDAAGSSSSGDMGGSGLRWFGYGSGGYVDTAAGVSTMRAPPGRRVTIWVCVRVVFGFAFRFALGQVR